MNKKNSKHKKYTCPMHPEVVSENKGKCPKCGGMDLVPMDEIEKDGGHGCHNHSASHGCGCHGDKDEKKEMDNPDKPPKSFIGRYLYNLGKKDLEKEKQSGKHGGGCC